MSGLGDTKEVDENVTFIAMSLVGPVLYFTYVLLAGSDPWSAIKGAFFVWIATLVVMFIVMVHSED